MLQVIETREVLLIQQRFSHRVNPLSDAERARNETERPVPTVYLTGADFAYGVFYGETALCCKHRQKQVPDCLEFER
jgi:hypothetical protein